MLDWLGAIGVARIFGLVDPNGGNPDGPAAVKRLENYLAKVPARVIWAAGKACLADRAHELEDFLACAAWCVCGDWDDRSATCIE